MSVAAFPEIAPAAAPPETRGPRTSRCSSPRARDGELETARFTDLPRLLRPGDLLVVNTSATLAAALPGRVDGADVVVHLSTPLDGDRWVLELRTSELGPREHGGAALDVELPAGGLARLLGPYRGSDAPGRGAAWSFPCRSSPTSPGTAPRSAIPARRALAAGRVPDDLRPRARQRRDAERRAAVQPRARHRAGERRHPASRRWSFTPASRRWSAARRPTRSATASRPRRPAW